MTKLEQAALRHLQDFKWTLFDVSLTEDGKQQLVAEWEFIGEHVLGVQFVEREGQAS